MYPYPSSRRRPFCRIECIDAFEVGLELGPSTLFKIRDSVCTFAHFLIYCVRWLLGQRTKGPDPIAPQSVAKIGHGMQYSRERSCSRRHNHLSRMPFFSATHRTGGMERLLNG
ncbi:predicted protein [Plenodomus lingam JN3]|uniref:Predicted protein n=1 Tax=Leptosphaeria maculans (strain JN3 / isolate v23.1.3 / race Av1-4-5-6-7-8) TaxID=985895 RepID=E4ZSX7_LEPMJ|nr:predicted protein [Plenodomus lingam JN3]CBX94565.1 predicted protein [Plenodomus lingam JN3]